MNQRENESYESPDFAELGDFRDETQGGIGNTFEPLSWHSYDVQK